MMTRQNRTVLERFDHDAASLHDTVPKEPAFKLASRQCHPEKTVVCVGDMEVGGDRPVIIAGPRAVESRDQILEAAWMVKRAGAHLLRGGAFSSHMAIRT